MARSRLAALAALLVLAPPALGGCAALCFPSEASRSGATRAYETLRALEQVESRAKLEDGLGDAFRNLSDMAAHRSEVAAQHAGLLLTPTADEARVQVAAFTLASALDDRRRASEDVTRTAGELRRLREAYLESLRLLRDGEKAIETYLEARDLDALKGWVKDNGTQYQKYGNELKKLREAVESGS